MRIEKIDENKIQITVSVDDLIERNIDFDALSYDSPEAQELFWDMMEQAEVELGFNAQDAQLCIEAIPDENDTFVVTITKVDDDGDFESFHKFIKNHYKRSDIKNKKYTRKIASTTLMYSFTKIDDMKSLATRLKNEYLGDSTLFKYKNTYFLILSRNKVQNVSNSNTFDLLVSEYGRKIANTGFYEGFLNEYAVKLSDTDALEIISDFY